MALLFPTTSTSVLSTTSSALLASTSSISLLAPTASLCIPAPPSYTSLLGYTNLGNEGPIVSSNYSQDLFSDFGFVVRARTDTEEDLLLWMFLYRQLGTDTIIDEDVSQTALLYGSFTDFDKSFMHDTPFINQGQNIDDYYKLGSLEFATSSEEVRWSCDGRVLISNPPHWKAQGEHAGVKVDLNFTQRGQFYYHIGQFNQLKNGEGDAGGIVHLRVNGTVTAKGKTFTITDGHAIHERILMAGVVPPRLDYMGGRGSPWINSWGEQLSFFILTEDTSTNSMFMITIDDESFVIQGNEYAWTEEFDHWLDPKTNQVNPRTWRVRAIMEKGTLDATVTAYGRWFYTWVRRGGIILVHTFMADSVATFTRKNGSVVEERHVAMVEYMRTLYNQALSDS